MLFRIYTGSILRCYFISMMFGCSEERDIPERRKSARTVAKEYCVRFSIIQWRIDRSIHSKTCCNSTDQWTLLHDSAFDLCQYRLTQLLPSHCGFVQDLYKLIFRGTYCCVFVLVYVYESMECSGNTIFRGPSRPFDLTLRSSLFLQISLPSCSDNYYQN